MESKLITLTLTKDDLQMILRALEFRHLTYRDEANKSGRALDRAFAQKYEEFIDHIWAQVYAQGGGPV